MTVKKCNYDTVQSSLYNYFCGLTYFSYYGIPAYVLPGLLAGQSIRPAHADMQQRMICLESSARPV